MDNMIFTSEVCGVVLIAPFDKISRPPCSTIRFIVFLSLFFRCFSPFSFYHRTFSLTTVYEAQVKKENIYAVFLGRNEEEVIVDPERLMGLSQLPDQEQGQGMEISM